MLSSSLDTLLKVFKTTSPQKLFAYDCVTLYANMSCNFIDAILIDYLVLANVWFKCVEIIEIIRG